MGEPWENKKGDLAKAKSRVIENVVLKSEKRDKKIGGNVILLENYKEDADR